MTLTFNIKSGIDAPKRTKLKYWSSFLQAFLEVDVNPRGLHLIFSGERFHNTLVKAVKSIEIWDIHSTIVVPE